MAAATSQSSPIPFIDEYLSGVLTRADAPAALLDACRYAALGPGKRVRPLLAWRAAQAVGGLGESSLPAGAAVELVHAFSLVHDDLPALDNDDLRRGRPTLHRHAGEAMAILAGDALLTYALEHLATAHFTVKPPSQSFARKVVGALAQPVTMAAEAAEEACGEASVRCALLLELSAATAKMIHGQVLDMAAEQGGGEYSLDHLRSIHANKTGALIRAACRMGAMCGLGRAEPDHPAVRACSRFGEAAGLLFQVVDDLIDVTQTADVAGKRTGKDAQAGKLTYPGLLGLDGAKAEALRLRSEALEALAVLGPAAEGLREIAEQIAGRAT